jgi:hypothetical protein
MNQRGLELPQLTCAKCSTKLKSFHDTNGTTGKLLELVDPCPVCTSPREVVRHFPSRSAVEAATKLAPAPETEKQSKPKKSYYKRLTDRVIRVPSPKYDENNNPLCVVCSKVLQRSTRGRNPLYCSDHKP